MLKGLPNARAKRVETSTVRPLRRMKPDGMIPDLNYDYLQIPAHVRQRIPKGEVAQPVDPVESDEQQPRRRTLLQMITGGTRGKDDEDLSIPTFIRRQAD